MNTRGYGRWITSALVVGAAVTGLSACTNDSPAPGPGGTAAGQGEDTAGIERRRAGRAEGSIRLGDLNKPKTAQEVGAPFDPCAVTWADFPAPVRPTDGQPHAPRLSQPGPDDPFKVNCIHDHSGKIEISMDGSGSPGTSARFFAKVIWGDQLDVGKIPNTTPKTWGGKAGVTKPLADSPQGKSCLGAMSLGTGVAIVDVLNGRFPSVDPCAVVDSLLTAIAAKTP